MKALRYFFVTAMLLPAGIATAEIELGGDLRMRHETIDQDDRDTRHRWRLRARVTADANVTEDLSAHLRIASGEDDPGSSNQSFDGGFSSKGLNLDRAYLKWVCPDTDATLTGGKYAVPFHKAGGKGDLLWDGDLNIEGLTLGYGMDAIGLNVGAYWAEERSSDSDTILYGAQVTADTEMGLSGAVGYFYWDNMQGFAPLFDDEDAAGNTVIEAEDGSLTYAEDYAILDAIVEFDTELGDMPVKVYGEYATNTDADGDEDSGFMIGVKLGKAGDPGTWDLGVDYRDLEADATVGAFSDSDSFGGGTNGEGFRIKGKYALARNWTANAAVFVQQIDPDGEDVDYRRLQLDLVARF